MISPKRRARASALIGAAWAAILVLSASVLPAWEGIMPPPADAAAAPKFQPLPGKIVGALVSDAREVLRREGRYGPEDVVCFASGEASYRWFYLPAPRGVEGEPMTFGVGEAGEKTRNFENLVMATAKTLKPSGLKVPYALAEVTVNGGEGSPAEEGFAATKLTVLDGSPGYPIHVDKVIRDLRKSHAAELRAEGKADKEMEQVRKQALQARKATGPREQSEWLKVTWLPEREVLRVEFLTEIRNGVYRYDRGVEPIRQDNPRSDVPPPAKESPRDAGVRHGTSFGVQISRVYEVSKEGRVIPGQPLKFRPFVEEIPPPGAAPRDGAPPPP